MAELLLTRAFTTALDVADGRTIIGRCVPFGVPTQVADPGGEPYTEVWRRGAFRRSIKAPGRVTLVYEHQPTIVDVLGHAVELTENDEGLDGVFRAIGAPGDHALELIRAGVVTGLSVQASVPPSGTRNVDGVIERTLARLVHVGLVAVPAYAGAGVTATRAGSGSAPGVQAAHCANEKYRLRFRRDTPTA